MATPINPAECPSEEDVLDIKFRNYLPKSKDLRKHCLPMPTIRDVERQLDEDMRKEIQASLDQDVLAQVTPKKPIWDLKRDLQKKLHVLARQTNTSILQLIRMNIEASKDAANIQATTTAAATVALAAEAAGDLSDSQTDSDQDEY